MQKNITGVVLDISFKLFSFSFSFQFFFIFFSNQISDFHSKCIHVCVMYVFFSTFCSRHRGYIPPGGRFQSNFLHSCAASGEKNGPPSSNHLPRPFFCPHFSLCAPAPYSQAPSHRHHRLLHIFGRVAARV